MIELLTGACTGKGLELVWEGRHEFLGHGNDAMGKLLGRISMRAASA